MGNQNNHPMRLRRRFPVLLAAATCLTLPHVAWAQATGDAAPQAREPTAAQALSEVVIVTARKREEASQDVPIAVSAFGGKQLDALYVRDLEDLTASIPNVQFDSGAAPGVAFFSIRGLGINSSIPTVDPSVGTFIDGVYVGTSYGVVLDTFDLAAVEVLRGPQGLLFGRNVTGGAVLLRSRRPSIGADPKFRSKVSVESGLQYTGAASAEGSLGAKAAGKITAYVTRDDGYFTNNADGSKDLGEQTLFFVRPTIVIQPTDKLDLTFIVEHGEATGDGSVIQNPSIDQDFNVSTDLEGSLDLKWTQATFETNLDVAFGNGQITNIFGYRQVRHSSLSDFDGTASNLFHAIFALDQEQYSNELRYNGTFLKDRLDLTTGLYFFTQDIVYRERRIIRGGSINSTFGGDQQQDTYGAFLSGDIKLRPELTLTLGARYSSETKDAQVATFSGAAPRCDMLDVEFTVRTCRFNYRGSAKFDNVTPKIGLTWEPSDDLLFYASATRGYRSGGFNVRNTSTPQSSGPTKDESQNAFELGTKTRLFDGRLRLNGSVFLNDISDLQRETNVADPVAGVIQALRNTADARIKGIEIDGVALLSNSLSVDFSVGYQNGEYTDVRIDLNGDGVINQRDYDLKIPRLAPLSVNIGANLDVPIPLMDGSLGFRAQYSYQDESAFTDSNSTFLRASDLVNASVKFVPGDRRFSVSLYGKNLLDTVTEGSNAPTPFGGFRTIGKGRIVGIEFSLDY